MVILQNSNDSLELVLSGAVATTELDYYASWVDSTSVNYTPSETNGITTGATALTVIPAPQTTNQGLIAKRTLKFMSVQNNDTQANTVLVQIDDNGDIRIICQFTLQIGDRLEYTDTVGFRCTTSDGAIKGTGPTGAQGTQGPQGFQGTAGGAQGFQGHQGFQGIQGAVGAQGAQGFTGAQGFQGHQGIQGSQGIQGAGFQGAQGFQGTQGSGFQGAQGSIGAQGNQGNQGTQGAGFQGAQGFQGDVGAQGLQGLQGFQGSQGLQGHQGAVGQTGAQGAQGHQGFQGVQGSVGAQGFQGDVGAQGSQGAQGLQGLQGSIGAQGLQGLQGSVGAQGLQGLQGAVGTTGAQGFQGSQGNQGLQGSQGNQGFQGITSVSMVFSNTSVVAGDTNASSTGDVAFTDPAYTIPANSLVAGSVVRIKAWGVYGTAVAPPTLNLKIKFGSNTYLATGAITTLGSVTNGGWMLQASLTVFTTGASGTIDAQGLVEYATAATTSLSVNIPNTGTQAIDTTATQAITLVSNWGTNNASNTITVRNVEVFIDNLSTAGTAGTFLPLAGGNMTGAINEAKGSNIASASTTNIGAGTGNYINITGTTTITAFDTVQAGTRRILNFNGALILTYNATSLILPTLGNITTAVGDTATFVSLGSGNWICVSYQKAYGGVPLSAYVNTDSSTSTGITSTETYLQGVLVPSLNANSVLYVDFQLTKTGTAGTATYKLYYNTTNNFSGSPVLLGTFNGLAASLYIPFERRIVYKNSLSSFTIFKTTVSAIDDRSVNSFAMSSFAVDLSGKYLIVTVSLQNSGDSFNVSNIQLINETP